MTSCLYSLANQEWSKLRYLLRPMWKTAIPERFVPHNERWRFSIQHPRVTFCFSVRHHKRHQTSCWSVLKKEKYIFDQLILLAWSIEALFEDDGLTYWRNFPERMNQSDFITRLDYAKMTLWSCGRRTAAWCNNNTFNSFPLGTESPDKWGLSFAEVCKKVWWLLF